MPDSILNTDIKFLAGVGPKKAEILNKEVEIFTYKDLLYYFPYKYIDRSKFYSISEITPGSAHIQIKGKITNFRIEGAKYKQRLVATFTDGAGVVELVWFKGLKWITQTYQLNKTYIIFGKPNIFKGKINFPHPDIEEENDNKNANAPLHALYNTSEKMKNGFLNSRNILKLQVTLMEQVYNRIEETLPAYLISELSLLSLKNSLLNIHFPRNTELLLKAQKRLKFEEFFFIQLDILRKRTSRRVYSEGHIFSVVGGKFNSFYKNNLTFNLTKAQEKVITEIRKDTKTGKQMNRLLQGDVGSGKTLVALFSMLLAIDNNFQTCLMAPTEILAIQHFNSIRKFLDGLEINVRLLTGSTKKRQREIISEELNNGELEILIGTHALIEDNVTFKNLGLVVIDEQHRFGVAQRAKLWKKNVIPPHVLVMTATPIPRTLAMTLYGDLDVSVIDELPPGRKPIKTVHYTDSKRLRLFGFMKEQIKLGRQIYVVYPLIKESEKMDYKDLEDGYESISRAFPPEQGYLVSSLHGRMKPEEKDKAMDLFKSGKAQILVSTTVIEVGVDVPNASVMVIESAEKFGLSQLHQLRGRVGRGADQSFCILMTGHKLSADARKRLKIMVDSNDGFVIAEEDLNLRGPGDMEGLQQSGMPFKLKIATLGKDNEILEFARKTAENILTQDPELKHPNNNLLLKYLENNKVQGFNWGEIS